MFTTIMIILINGINISYCGFSRLQKQNNILEKVQKSIEVKICDEIGNFSIYLFKDISKKYVEF